MTGRPKAGIGRSSDAENDCSRLIADAQPGIAERPLRSRAASEEHPRDAFPNVKDGRSRRGHRHHHFLVRQTDRSPDGVAATHSRCCGQCAVASNFLPHQRRPLGIHA